MGRIGKAWEGVEGRGGLGRCWHPALMSLLPKEEQKDLGELMSSSLSGPQIATAIMSSGVLDDLPIEKVTAGMVRTHRSGVCACREATEGK